MNFLNVLITGLFILGLRKEWSAYLSVISWGHEKRKPAWQNTGKKNGQDGTR